MPPIDPVALAQDLIRCPSVAPADGGAIELLAQTLERLGFTCHRLAFGDPEIRNLYARLGEASPNFCFAGHTDVVPVGDQAAWSVDPFAATITDGRLYGRGAADMKSALAAMVAAASAFLAERGPPAGSISFLITGDEEGRATHGTRAVLDWMAAEGERIDACVLGEPTNPERLGSMIKIGRRGSLTGRLTVRGTQGHVAYPHLADNPLPRLIRMLAALDALELDQGTKHFDASNLEIVSIDVGNPAANVIPAKGEALFNIRFNDRHSGESLTALLHRTLGAIGAYELAIEISGESFLCSPGPLSALVAEAVAAATGERPEFSTTGGTSDARFIHHHCPVVEFGLVGKTMHKIDESAAVADITRLAAVYRGVLERYFTR